MLIGGFQKSSLIDYRGQIAAIVFLHGCNFLCPYCHNPEIVTEKPRNKIDEKEILDFLKTRKGKLDGVVISGGEPTLQKDLPDFIKKIKDLGFLVKLDTNGTNPSMVKAMLNENLLDYIAMDIKGPYERYREIVKKPVNIEDIKTSFETVVNSGIDYEFRTTVTKELLCYEDFVKINEMFNKFGKIKRYYLQNFQKSKHVDPNFVNAHTIDDLEIAKISSLFENSVEQFMVR